jgi:hypothetical protein
MRLADFDILAKAIGSMGNDERAARVFIAAHVRSSSGVGSCTRVLLVIEATALRPEIRLRQPDR